MDRLDHGDEIILSTMLVNEEGVLRHMPRNALATEIYQRLVRYQFKGHADPFAACDAEFKKRIAAKYGADAVAGMVDITPKHAIEAAKKDGPWIAGNVIYFEGYTIPEVDRALNDRAAADKKNARGAFKFSEESCPGHVASRADPRICARCGVHIDSFRPPDDEDEAHAEPPK